MEVLGQVIALFLLMLFGLAAVRGKIIGENGVGVLNQVVLYFSLPCLTIAKLQREAEPQLMEDLVDVFWMGGLSMLLCGAAAIMLFRKAAPERRAVLINMAMFSNAGFMGFPVLTAAYGADKLIYGVIYVAIFNLLNWSLGLMVFSKQGFQWKKVLLNPTMIASVVGIALFLCHILLPDFITSALNLMGDTTTPLALFIVGARLSRLRAADFRDVPLLCACGLRLIALPLLIWGVTELLGAADMVQGVIVLCTAMPCAATLVVQAESTGGDGAMASRGVALSTALSCITIPLVTLLMT